MNMFFIQLCSTKRSARALPASQSCGLSALIFGMVSVSF
jgi:hypothetical protein